MDPTYFIEKAGIDYALEWHLTSNHYPPVPMYMFDICKQAIDFAIAEDWDEMIHLPDEVLYRGQSEVPVWAVIENFHLHSFIVQDDPFE
jgi:hypothetical protein